ncbi:hypothetical protein LAZ67_3006184 [Cordylochernes scorpioides]|uniref:RNA-directed DNA polymerase n=1 Tax=Cordylochernes scorpioides TaxID=51811 RepID=A0ABY6KAY6_9ARAC|nr:hypothetical protein LAZ67_3006184 [Cordylochernes scorpioides]
MNKVHQEYNHPGISQMTRIITTQYYWKGISKSIEKFVKSCHTCQIIKRPKGKPYGALGQIPLPQQPFDLISIDTIAGFSKYGHSKTYLHVIVDHLTRYAWTFPSKSTSTLTYIQTLKTVLHQGSPKRLLSDRAPAFTSEKFRKFLITQGIQPLLTTSNNPQANGLIERLNATITGKLRLAYLENPKASWTQLVKRVTQTYNNTPHSVTSFPPTYLMFNVIPPDLRTHLNPYLEINIAREIANSRTQNKHKKDKETFDKQHRTPHFEVNDLVLVKNYRHPDTDYPNIRLRIFASTPPYDIPVQDRSWNGHLSQPYWSQPHPHRSHALAKISESNMSSLLLLGSAAIAGAPYLKVLQRSGANACADIAYKVMRDFKFLMDDLGLVESQICKQRLTYFGHIMRANGLEKMLGNIEGRLALSWLEGVRKMRVVHLTEKREVVLEWMVDLIQKETASSSLWTCWELGMKSRWNPKAVTTTEPTVSRIWERGGRHHEDNSSHQDHQRSQQLEAQLFYLFIPFKSEGIWCYYLRDGSGQNAQRIARKRILKCVGGSTKGLHVHQKAVHGIKTSKRNVKDEVDTQTPAKKTPKISILDHFSSVSIDRSTDAVLARMIALDGLPFSVFVTSKDLRKCLNALGHEIPLSAETINIKVCRYADTFREKVVRELQMEKEKGLTLDEWTSIRSKRYLNINIHSRTKVWNLGLTQISGVFSSEQCKYVIGAKLLEFGIDFETDIVCVTTDGCAMMVKLDHIIVPLQQLCYAHGLHLAVMDVLYAKKTKKEDISAPLSTKKRNPVFLSVTNNPRLRQS